MVSSKFKYLFVFICFIVSFSINAQRHLIGNVAINKSSVYVGEPVEVSVSIFTSTWFTEGINPGNIKVNDAFTIYFRSLSTSKQINGKTYAGVILYFNVFPYSEKDIEFPALEFTVNTPDDGGFKGVKRTVKTPSRVIKVKPVPPGFNKNEWLVTSNVSVSDIWSSNKKEVKVGDVLERKITRNVSGTVSELIPPINWDSIPAVSLYPTRSVINSNKSKTAISANRTDGIRYLFEKEGTVEIPEMVLSWWNPYAKKVYKRTLKARTIEVLPNPDLGMLTTMKDSLNVSVKIDSNGIEEEESATIFGLSKKQFALLLVGFIILLYVLFRIVKSIYKKLKLRKEVYKVSEAYFFKLFINALKKEDSVEILNALYQWIDKLQLKEPTIQFFVSKYGAEELSEAMTELMNASDSNKSVKLKLKTTPWVIARKKFLRLGKNEKVSVLQDWINP
ncbi:BatD family protein [Lutibacter holmesii]|uniref:BatD family protein n=1 Tax=Lutibacter holmesii TaxID=1137985 RepID=A0ABW3WPY1_9FLAO